MTVPVHTALTSREIQILRQLVKGSTTRQIADSYGIAHQTVKNYVTVIYEKLGVRHRAQLLRVFNQLASAQAASDTERHLEG